MKHKSLLMMMLLCFAFLGVARAQQQELTVYPGTTTNNRIPAYILYFDDFARSQYVIPADSLIEMTGGTISGLRYYTSTNNTPYTTVSTVDVYIMEVDYTTISAFEPKTNATIVYQGLLNIEKLEDHGELYIQFSTPYQYSGGNLLIGVENTTDAGYKGINFYGQGGQTGASISGSNGTSLDNVTPTQQNFIAKTTFTYTPGSGSNLSFHSCAIDKLKGYGLIFCPVDW